MSDCNLKRLRAENCSPYGECANTAIQDYFTPESIPSHVDLQTYIKTIQHTLNLLYL